MKPSGPSNDISPQKTYRTMARAAVAIFCLLGLAIFSLSRLSTSPWSSRLSTPDFHSSLRQKLPHFEYVEGEKRLSPQNFEGHWTLLSFWSYSCTPCLVELPGLNQLLQGWQGPELDVVTVNIDQDADLEQARAFVLANEITLPVVYDKQGVLKSALDVHAYPQHFLIDPQLNIVWSSLGAYLWNEPQVRDQLIQRMDATEKARQ